MRIVYFGTGEFAVAPLRAIAPHVIRVVTQPPRPQGRGHRLQVTAVHALADTLGLPVETPERVRVTAWIDSIAALEADLLVVASYGKILPARLLTVARRGAWNLHGSLLPEYRGAAPIQRAIMDGRSETGVCLMQMDVGMDTGDVLDVVRTPIGPDETYGELQARLSELAAGQLARAVESPDSLTAVAQDHAGATHAAKITREDTELDVGRAARAEYNRFRGVTPNPGAGLPTSLGRVRVSAARWRPESGEPGTILSVAPLVVAFGEGALELIEIQPEGKKRMSGRDWANGARLAPGLRLSAPGETHSQPTP
ncbi:MAG: methionyl-tRNA formyltransferase [Fimbriimonadaceae bacterium]|nr:methionyl-tRNA formyltransferase [Fimbriimonadaceae bacterium]